MRPLRFLWLPWLLLACCSEPPSAPVVLDTAEPAAGVTKLALAAGPPKRLLTHRFVVNVRTAPRRDALRLGYLRAGSVFTANTNQPVGSDRCRRGWYEIAETGGFVCSGHDVIAFEGKRLPERRARQPDLEALLPYPYAYTVRPGAALYRRLPTDSEAEEFEGYRAVGATPPVPNTDLESAEAVGSAPTAAAVSLTSVANTDTELAEDEGPPTLASLKGQQDSALERRLVKGFYLSLDREMPKGARRYWRTQANGFVPYRSVREVKGSDFHGVTLSRAGAVDAPPQGVRLPVGFVMSNRAFAYSPGNNGKIRRGKPAAYHSMFAIVGHVELSGLGYEVAADGTYYRSQEITRIDVRPPPNEVATEEKWIDVDLERQTLVAYEGAAPVFATLVSTGRVTNSLDPLRNFATPTGSFRILSKHLTHTMDGDHAVDGPFSIEDVPYVMYFQLAYAIHSAFWHNSFGRTRSHGCINASPADARWLFQWVTPELPKHWHAVYPSPGRPSTRLYIHGEAP